MAAGNKHDFIVAFGPLATSLKQFNAVRYVAVACATLALLERILACRRETRTFWTAGAFVPKVLYLINRYLNLFCLGLDVFIFTLDLPTISDCAWWFSFRAWFTVVVSTVVQCLLLFKLYCMYGQSKPLLAGFAILILGQVVTNCILTARDFRSVMFTSSPGIWFSGCFPVLSGTTLWHVWISVIVMQICLTVAAVIATVKAWRIGPHSLWATVIQDGLLHFLAILFGVVFCGVWWMAAPLPMISMAPTLASALYAVHGCRLLPEDELYPARVTRDEVELAAVRRAGDLDSIQGDLEKGYHGHSFDRSPLSQVPTLFAPPTVTAPPMSDDTLAIPSPVPSPAIIQSPRPESEATLQNDSNVGKDEVVVEDDELDLVLAEEYDENGFRRPPKRTHERKWKSDEAVTTTASSSSAPIIPSATRPRPTSAFLSHAAYLDSIASSSSPGLPSSSSLVRIHALDQPPHPPMMVFPEERLPSPQSHPHHRRRTSSTSKKRISLFFHRHRSDVGSISVPEEEVPHSFDPPPQAEHPSPLGRRQSSSSRVRRFLSSSGSLSPPPSPLSVRYGARRGGRESDAMTICTVSTTFAFDNTNSHDAPDFTN